MKLSMTRGAVMAASALGALLGAAERADAFCGFYVGGATSEMFNNATQVVLMRQGTTTVLSMQNNYQGPPEGFALVVPVPVVINKEQVKTLPRELFSKVDTLGAPRLVEYWEQDPCRQLYPMEDVEMVRVTESVEEEPADESSDEEEYHVKVEARFSVEEYDVVVLSATESTGLDRWLRDNRYQIPKGAEPLLRPYIAAGTKFFVAKVDPKKVTFENGMATLSPLRFQYDSPEFALPIRLGMANSSGTQDLIVNILAPQRYEVANYPNVAIPTNLIVRDPVRTRFAEFYAALFDETLKKAPGAVVTEYAWDSGSCDPCPGPTLAPDDLATLGADVIASTYQDANPYALTLTRLHARYGKDLSDDLVFRAVGALEGGRGVPGPQGELSMAVRYDSGVSNFQGRYVILHPWTGSITCASPSRGEWGGPPSDVLMADPALAAGAQPKAATNLAFAPRGNVNLAEVVAVDVPQVGVLASSSAPLLPPLQRRRGCACDSGGGAGGAAGAAALTLLAMLGWRRRRGAVR
ncbi:MAG: DUF2330 domain-containing protein [Kofleriaceae bacterium]